MQTGRDAGSGGDHGNRQGSEVPSGAEDPTDRASNRRIYRGDADRDGERSFVELQAGIQPAEEGMGS